MATLAARGDSVPPYVVVRMERDDSAGAGHDHVMAVRTDDPDGGETRWTTVQVIEAVRDGERFVVDDGELRGETVVEPAICPECATVTLTVA